MIILCTGTIILYGESDLEFTGVYFTLKTKNTYTMYVSPLYLYFSPSSFIISTAALLVVLPALIILPLRKGHVFVNKFGILSLSVFILFMVLPYFSYKLLSTFQVISKTYLHLMHKVLQQQTHIPKHQFLLYPSYVPYHRENGNPGDI